MLFNIRYQAVESLRQGKTPEEAADDIIRRILKHYPDYSGAMMVADKSGEYGKCVWYCMYDFFCGNTFSS